jgi:hypothetical protein
VATEKEETAITENQTENKMTTTKTKTQIAQTAIQKNIPSKYTKACPKASMSGATALIKPTATLTNGWQA